MKCLPEFDRKNKKNNRIMSQILVFYYSCMIVGKQFLHEQHFLGRGDGIFGLQGEITSDSLALQQ